MQIKMYTKYTYKYGKIIYSNKKIHLLVDLYSLPIIVFFQSFECSDCNSLSMTSGTLVEIFLYLFSDFLWFETNWFDHLSAFTTVKRDISPLRIKIIFTLLPEGRNIYEICIGSRHDRTDKRIEERIERIVYFFRIL